MFHKIKRNTLEVCLQWWTWKFYQHSDDQLVRYKLVFPACQLYGNHEDILSLTELFLEVGISVLLEYYPDIVDVVRNSPIDEFLPHLFSFFFVELTSSKKPEEIVVIPLCSFDTWIEIDHEGSKLFESLQLFLWTVPRPSKIGIVDTLDACLWSSWTFWQGRIIIKNKPKIWQFLH